VSDGGSREGGQRISRVSAWGRAALILAVVVGLDQGAKHLIIASIAQGEERPVFPAVSLVHVRNSGVAFSVLAGGHILLVVAVIALALGGLVAYFATHAARPLLWLPTGLLMGGALGNIVDRARDGAVTDFIKLPLWPAFNVADMAITVGVLALLFVLDSSREARGA